MRHKKPISPAAKEFARFIRQVRKEAGDPQKVLANLIEIERSGYVRKENGSIAFSLDEALKIMAYYRIGIDPDGKLIANLSGLGTHRSLQRQWIELLPKMTALQSNISSAIAVLQDYISSDKDE